MVLRGIAVAASLLVALTACSGPAPEPRATNQQGASVRGTSSPIDKLEAYSFCKALLASRLGYDRTLSAGADSFGAADITAVDDTFEVTLHGPTPTGNGTTFCVLTGTLGDPRLLYTGDPAAWAGMRTTVIAANPDRVIDEQGRGDKATPIDALLAWATCRVLRLAKQPTDYIAGWANFNATDLKRGRQGIEIYEVFPAGKSDVPPVDTSSLCVIDGTLAAPYPVVYIEKGPGDEDARDYYGDVIADELDRSL
jgi:hypothetical protein